MNDNVPSFMLKCAAAGVPAPVLAGVEARGRLDGVLFEMTLRQTYRNAGEHNLEVVYTFPLAHGAVLLGFASELNGRRMEGVMVAKPEAERQYEKSLAEGEAPVMLEANATGLHTANIGNLKPGDEIVLEVRYGQVLSFEQGRLRIAVPTTIAPRYGAAQAAGLQPQQVPSVSMAADHGLALSIDVMAPLDGGTLNCPTHRIAREPIPGGVRMSLQGQAWLDRDWVLLVKPREDRPSLVVQAQDSRPEAAPRVVMAALQPRAEATPRRVAVKALVDCSGSMAGASILSARAAMQGLLTQLTGWDCLSISRFGKTVEHVFPPTHCSAAALSAASRAVDHGMVANLGGTEMEAALQSVFAIKVPEGHDGADVLLVTDGQIWKSDAMVAAARASGHRVFAIGVGSAPVEGVLRALAEATGGACEFATPGEALEAAAQRMLARMRLQRWNSVRVDWGAEPVWQSPIASTVFAGDTVIVFAGMGSQVAIPAIRLMARDACGHELEIARGEASVPSPGDALTRIAASRRMAGVSKPQALGLAVSYQLMSQQTNCILVHARNENEKATEPAELHRVAVMLAAGWGATGTVSKEPAVDSPSEASGLRIRACVLPGRAGSFGAAPNDGSRAMRDRRLESFPFADDRTVIRPLISTSTYGRRSVRALEALCFAVVDHLRLGRPGTEIANIFVNLQVHPTVREAIDALVAHGMDANAAWALFAIWVNWRRGTEGAADAALLAPLMGAVNNELRVAGLQVLEASLGGIQPGSWPPSRQERLQRAMRSLRG